MTMTCGRNRRRTRRAPAGSVGRLAGEMRGPWGRRHVGIAPSLFNITNGLLRGFRCEELRLRVGGQAACTAQTDPEKGSKGDFQVAPPKCVPLAYYLADHVSGHDCKETLR